MKCTCVTTIALVAASLNCGVGAAARSPDLPSLPLLSPIFQTHGVVQRDQPIKVWGWAAPNEEVKVVLDNSNAIVRAASSGRWSATLGPLPAGGPHSLTVQAKSGASAVLNDVLV